MYDIFKRVLPYVLQTYMPTTEKNNNTSFAHPNLSESNRESSAFSSSSQSDPNAGSSSSDLEFSVGNHIPLAVAGVWREMKVC